MVDQCVSECGNTRCRYNAAGQRTADVRLVYMRDRTKMGCEGWQPVKGETKPAKISTAASKSGAKAHKSGAKVRKGGTKAPAGATRKRIPAKHKPKETAT